MSTTTLCLACSSSLPPRKAVSVNQPFTTQCCGRPICPRCLSSNPRLARYNPCLACLGGIGVVQSKTGLGASLEQPINVDGAVRDEDNFAIGDDEDASDEEVELSAPRSLSSGNSSQTEVDGNGIQTTIPADGARATSQITEDIDTHTLTYQLKPNDTLRGIALRFGLNGRELCALNSLPPSTLSTTPHILHTRTTINLPPSIRNKLTGDQAPVVETPTMVTERETRRAHERAERRLALLTKEVDWRVAKAYVALADDPDEIGRKLKEDGQSSTGVGGQRALEVAALNQYLDDDEWEREERRQGRSVAIPRFPFVGGCERESKRQRNWLGIF